MSDPFTIASVAGAGVTTGEGSVSTTTALNTADVGSQLSGGESVGLGAAGSVSTDVFVGSLDLDTAHLRDVMLSRAESSGPALTEAFRKAGTELPQVSNPVGDIGPAASIFDVARWHEWSPRIGECVTPQDIAERFRPLRDANNLESYSRNLMLRNPGFAKEVVQRREQFCSSVSPAGKDAAVLQARKSIASKQSESITADGFKPYFSGLEQHRRVATENGTTIIDSRFTDARSPIILGRGHVVAEGGTLSVEVKTGQPAYLAREMSHIIYRQVPGHHAVGDKSLVLVSRDVYSMSGERAARDNVAEAGSHMMALLPEKRTMDEVILRLLRDRVES